MDLYGVIGNPIQHSLSPQIHQHFAEQTQQKITYERILVAPDQLAFALQQFKQRGGKGLNVTSPFKEQAFKLMDQCSERATEAGAVNTIRFNPDGSFYGDNTDGIGFIRDLTVHQQFVLRGKSILIIGAGGAARGILPAIMAEDPHSVTLLNRTEHKAHALAKQFSIQTGSLTDIKEKHVDLIINCLSNGADDSLFPQKYLLQNTCCYDLAYGKTESPFLFWARQNGAKRCSNGLGMLVEQAAEAFYVWRNVMPKTQSILLELKGDNLYGGFNER